MARGRRWKNLSTGNTKKLIPWPLNTTQEMARIVDFNTRVQFLDLPWEDVIYSKILPSLSWKDLFHLRRVSRGCLHLVNSYFLNQHHIDLSVVGNRITGLAFQVITRSSHLLTALILPKCKFLNDDLLRPVFESNSCLEIVNMSGCQSISTTSAQILATRCRRLQKLILKDCFWFTAAALMVIAYHCPLLNLIDLTSCWQVNDEAVCALVHHCPSLMHISLAKIYGITNSSLIAISYCCSNLKFLDLVGCWRITDDGIK